jgi:hypothetical protein
MPQPTDKHHDTLRKIAIFYPKSGVPNAQGGGGGVTVAKSKELRMALLNPEKTTILKVLQISKGELNLTSEIIRLGATIQTSYQTTVQDAK